MNSERNIVIKLYESKDYKDFIDDKDIDEASFESGGKIYKCSFGRYSCDGEPISREDYLRASDTYRKESGLDSYYGSEKSFYSRKNPAKLVNKMNKDKEKSKKKNALPNMSYKANNTYKSKSDKMRQLSAGAKFLKNLHPEDPIKITNQNGEVVGKSVEFQDAMDHVKFEKSMAAMGGYKNEAGQWEVYDSNDNTVIFSRDEDTGKISMLSYNYDIHNK